MVSEDAIRDCIDRAATAVAPAWPIHSFVAANPLAGFEDRPFHEAVERADRLFGADGYPSAETFRRAWADGRIDPAHLEAELAEHGRDRSPEELLDRMASDTAGGDAEGGDERVGRVDRVLAKWIAAFLDEGRATWPMPHRERGFYAAVRAMARHDRAVPTDAVDRAPDDPIDAIETVLADVPFDRWEAVFEHHLTALPGWTGLVVRRAETEDDDWQAAHPITLAGYLAVRLLLADALDAPIEPPAGETEADAESVPVAERWLRAWEATYRERLVEAVADASADRAADAADGGRPDAQLAFCLDTRSEILRRHVEAAGAYETFGYAGFFGVPMRYERHGDDASVDACPPIVDARHRIAERPDAAANQRAAHDRWRAVREAGKAARETLETNAATAFGFVESAGSGYGLALAARTLVPGRVRDLLQRFDDRIPGDHEVCSPSLAHDARDGADLPRGLRHEERVEYAAAAFETMGWEEFARLVVFAGHGSETTNNPFESSLDCGACAGNPGGPNARVLAATCNDEAVRESLRDRGIDVPEDTHFLAAEHDTTTDEVTLFDADVPESHREDVARLRADLETARRNAAAERTDDLGAQDAGSRDTERRAADWAETRPEWGLAGNAGLVVGRRALTEGLDLDGRVFLHSYDWRTDPDGDALASIVAGPVVVGQWINAQYYFATVDNAVFGSGSKVTQNPVGNVGVYQGNGGDVYTGLPAQSVALGGDEPYHQPLRLSTVVHAPVDRVQAVLDEHERIAERLSNGWFSLTVVDPTRDHRTFQYRDADWRAVADDAVTASPAVADD
jgi:uncharacterized protein YbcC (UPF0753/DUF2309 family)